MRNPNNVCRRGHPLTEDNVVINSFDKRRRCKICMKRHQKRAYAKKRGYYVYDDGVKRQGPKIYNPAWPGVY